MKEAIIVTMTLGLLKTQYDELFIPSIKAYADKWNFDFFCINDFINPLDSVRNSQNNKYIVYMQKFLIASLPNVQNYKYVIFIDADILINYHSAPNILEGIPEGKIAAVDEKYIWGNKENASSTLKRFVPEWASTAEEYYKYYKFPQIFSKQFNSGVFVFQPKFHTSFFKEVYDKYIDLAIAGQDVGIDQAPFNYEANSRDLVYYLDERFNRPWIITWGLLYSFLDEVHHKPILQQAIKSVFNRTYFLHFAGKFGWDLLRE
jgi:lipopolysaccharide biosynthesis glycosyltransferase